MSTIDPISSGGDGPEVVTVVKQPTAVIRAKVPMEELPAFFDRAFQRLPQVLADQQAEVVGAAFALHHAVPTEVADLEVGFATRSPIEADGDVEPSRLPGGRMARMVHRGAFDGLGESWGRLQAWIGEQDLTPGEALWEVYLTEPRPDMDPDELRTLLCWSVA
jgi:effector-binding domain-containing protein